MGRLAGWFGSRSVSAVLDRARQKLAAGKLDDAAAAVETGLDRFPASSALLDMRLSIRRARAHKGMRKLEHRIELSGDPLAYEELVKLYLALDLPDNARRKAEEYVQVHANRDTPHLLLGEMFLELYLDDLQARHGHRAREHLLQAAHLNGLALQPRLLLAELYYCIGALRALAGMHETLTRMAPENSAMEAAFAVMAEAGDPEAQERLEGIFERIEADGTLVHDPADWPLSRRRNGRSELCEEAADRAVDRLLAEGILDEVVLLRRDGAVITHASPLGMGAAGASPPPDGVGQAADEPAGTLLGAPRRAADGSGFMEVVRTVSTRVFPQAREFDMGRFRRCTIRSRHGNVVIGKVGHLMVAARGRANQEPERMWQRLTQELESAAGRKRA